MEEKNRENWNFVVQQIQQILTMVGILSPHQKKIAYVNILHDTTDFAMVGIFELNLNWETLPVTEANQ